MSWFGIQKMYTISDNTSHQCLKIVYDDDESGTARRNSCQLLFPLSTWYPLFSIFGSHCGTPLL